MWEWWLKKVGTTNNWSPMTDIADAGVSIRVSDGTVFEGKCPGKDAGTFEQLENATGQRLSKIHVSKAFVKHMMEDFV